MTVELHARGRKLVASEVPEVAGGVGLPAVRPIDLLDALGRATSSLPALYHGGAGGLPGTTALSMSSQWAILKYLWAFSPPQGTLRFSPIVKTVREHQRSVFSEHFGIAVGTTVTEKLLHRAAFSSLRIVDADALVDDQMLAVAIGPLSRLRPDYFFYTGGPAPALFIVEVKGTSSGRAVMVQQLARGIEQVASVPRVAGYATRRIVLGAVATNAGITGYAVELQGFDEDEKTIRDTWRDLASVASRESRPIPDDFVAAAAQVEIEDVPLELDQTTFDNVIDSGEDARLLTFAGLPATARFVDSLRPAFQSAIAGLETRSVDGRIYRGAISRVPLAGNNAIEIFAGVEGDLLEAAARPRSGRRKDDDRAATLVSSPGSFTSWVADNDELFEISVRSGDGCLLQVGIT